MSDIKNLPNGWIEYKGLMLVQDRQEFEWLCGEIRKVSPKVVVEIGMERGGTMTMWKDIAGEGALCIGIDINLNHLQTKFDGGVVLVEGSSYDPLTVEKVKSILNGRPIDFLFIDGDHSEEGVTQDYNLYGAMVRPGGIVGFHDIRTNDFWFKNRDNKKDYISRIGTGIIYK